MSSVHTYPQMGPHRITPFATRARRPEPASRGFLGSAAWRHEVGGLDEGAETYNHHEKKSTQEEQDAEDEKARKQAMKNLINSWQERLQLISVITTFFATTEAAMLVNTKPATPDDLRSNILRVSNAGFLGSLILHVYASVLSFLGAFLLISYKLREARREEMIIEGIVVDSPHEINNAERGAINSSLPRDDSQLAADKAHYSIGPPIFAANPHIEQVGLLRSKASSPQLLSRIHAVCVSLAAVGFVLAIIGIVAYAWALQPMPVGIFTSVCLGGALLSMFFLFV